MVTVYVGGKKLCEVMVPDDLRAASEPIILWEPGITRTELDACDAVPGLSFDEVKKRLGWQ